MQNYYYPFGMGMPGRKYNSTAYRYGFNGKENDSDVKGEGNAQDYGMRIYDSRLGRFLSVDPLAKQYPELSSYQFGSNSPIFGVDRDGLELWGNFSLFDIWMKWKFGDPTGTKTLLSGIGEKTVAQTQQTSYHDNVSKTAEKQLDHINNIQANVKIAAGTAQVTKFVVKTSADIISTFAPIGEGITVIFKGAEIVHNGIKVERLLVGSSNKIAVIGRSMEDRVLKFAAGFEKQTGQKIETFQPKPEVLDAWQKLLKQYNGKVPDNIARESQLFKDDVKWTEKIKKEGHSVFDLGLGAKDGKEIFFKMETKSFFND